MIAETTVTFIVTVVQGPGRSPALLMRQDQRKEKEMNIQRLTVVTLNTHGVQRQRFVFQKPRDFRLVSDNEVLSFTHEGGRRTWRVGEPSEPKQIPAGRVEMFGVTHRYYADGVECSPRLLATLY